MKYITYIFIVIMTLSGLSACGGGGGSSSTATPTTTTSVLAGTWAGSYEYYDSTAKSVVNAKVEIVIDSAGNISDVRSDGNSLGVTGTMTNIGGSKYSYALSDGTTGGFLVDASNTHAGFLDINGSFGAVQKGASTSGVTYSSSDFVGTWSGYTVVVDDSENVINQGNSTARIDVSGAVSGTDYDGVGFTGNFTGYSSTYGWSDGSWYKAGKSGYLTAYATPDKQFAATYACDSSFFPSTAPGISYCIYSVWNRQIN